MKLKRKEKRGKKRRAMAQSMFIILLAVASLATDGFGAAPPSQFSKGFREVLGKALPHTLINQINPQLDSIDAASIPTQASMVKTRTTTNSNSSLFSDNFLAVLSKTLPVELIEYINRRV